MGSYVQIASIENLKNMPIDDLINWLQESKKVGGSIVNIVSNHDGDTIIAIHRTASEQEEREDEERRKSGARTVQITWHAPYTGETNNDA